MVRLGRATLHRVARAGPRAREIAARAAASRRTAAAERPTHRKGTAARTRRQAAASPGDDAAPGVAARARDHGEARRHRVEEERNGAGARPEARAPARVAAGHGDASRGNARRECAPTFDTSKENACPRATPSTRPRAARSDGTPSGEAGGASTAERGVRGRREGGEEHRTDDRKTGLPRGEALRRPRGAWRTVY